MHVFSSVEVMGRKEIYHKQRNKPAKILINHLVGRQDGLQHQGSPAIEQIYTYPITLKDLNKCMGIGC